MDDLKVILERYPFLASPAALMRAFNGPSWKLPRHLEICNSLLRDVGANPEGRRVMVNMPYRHGKSDLFSRAFPAWKLLLWPDTNIILVAQEEAYAINKFGAVVKQIIEKFGPMLGIRLRRDVSGKGEWQIDGHKGGMVCRSPAGGQVGRDADLYVIDDLIRNPTEALSQVIKDNQWAWYETVVFGRIMRGTSVIVVGTRWCSDDIFGRILKEAAVTGEKWEHIKFHALAKENDILGRTPGEALWPEMVTPEHLKIAETRRGRWFHACWQQEPSEEEEGAVFKPDFWPKFCDLGDAFSIPHGLSRKVILHTDCTVLVAIDWAAKKTETSDKTAFIAAALLPQGELAILDIVNERFRPEDRAMHLDRFCRRWRPFTVAGEDDILSTSMLAECRRWPNIPEIHCLPIKGQMKIVRAFPAVTHGNNGRIYLPDPTIRPCPWLQPYLDQLRSFTGMKEEPDDMVDCTGILGRLLDLMKGSSAGRHMEQPPCVLVPGRELDTEFGHGADVFMSDPRYNDHHDPHAPWTGGGFNYPGGW